MRQSEIPRVNKTTRTGCPTIAQLKRVNMFRIQEYTVDSLVAQPSVTTSRKS